ncbi:MAG TPA: T9SS type A sorting domain-containing protein [Flavobacteriales bacterium]|nr:T9SS type A sorting domain-containing protein [Flavobacteriales bacterium]
MRHLASLLLPSTLNHVKCNGRLIALWACAWFVNLHGQVSTPCTVVGLPPNLQQGLIFYTPFCATPNDLGPQTYMGTNNGASLGQDRFLEPNKAMGFDGASSHVNYGQAASLLGMDSLTICFWVAPEVNPGNGQAVILGNLGSGGGSGCGYQCFIEVSTGNMVFEYRHSIGEPLGHFAVTSEPSPTGVWTFYSVTYYRIGSSAVVNLYKNGVLDGTHNFDNPINYQNPGPFRVGTNIDMGGRFFKGKIDDIMIYNRVLSASELEQIHSGEVQLPCVSTYNVTIEGLNTSYQTTDAPSALVGTPAGGVYFGHGVTAATFDPAAAGPGTHTVIYTYIDQNGCVNSTGLCTAVSVGIGINDPTSGLGGVRVYPNPTDGIFTLELGLQGLVMLTVHDSRGRQVLNQTFMAQGAKSTRSIDLSGEAAGAYVLQVGMGERVVNQQLIKQ